MFLTARINFNKGKNMKVHRNHSPISLISQKPHLLAHTERGRFRILLSIER